MKTWHIHIEGQVQGVGFRPYVYLMARKYGINGWVNNTIDGVHIEINSEEKIAHEFFSDIKINAPGLSCITQSELRQTKKKFFENFQIVHSNSEGKANLLLTPDFGICEDCRNELYSNENRRQGYPFISCTNCGPRFSIIKQLPYDRENTSMLEFKMCKECESEYDNPVDRRYYSQTNSCPKCPIELSLYNNQQEIISEHQNEIIERVVNLWETGRIVAIKGVGGYLLTCVASNAEAIQLLRERKHRPSKPFALMVPDFRYLKNIAEYGEEEIQSLAYPVAPIVLLKINEGASSHIAIKDIAPNLDRIGAMLPYTPLFELLLNEFGQAIVATSGNVTNSPIVFQDDKAIKELSNIADFILVNNREIIVPQDDSVIKHTSFFQKKIIIRRSRGLAPTYINPEIKWPEKGLLAMGAMLKSTFGFLNEGNVYLSQYLGDLEHYDTQLSYGHTLEHFLKLFKYEPEVIICDKHPQYPSTELGKLKAEQLNIAVEEIQHHIAHFGAVLGENNLIQFPEPILGVIWDGTGLGDDGQIWGGEFFVYDDFKFSRQNHFEYFDFILGDKMPREPRVSALSSCWGLEGVKTRLKKKFSNTEWSVYSKLLNKESQLKTSSVGRLFDAVASLLGILDKQTFEGEAAMRLEAIAVQYVEENGMGIGENYFENEFLENKIPTKVILEGVNSDLNLKKSRGFIAAKFHYSLVLLVRKIAENLKIEHIAFSGGVFQNGLLVDFILHEMQEDFKLYFHKQLSPNDESVSFGQLVYYHIKQLKINKTQYHVLSNTR